MADRFVWSGATGAGTGADWANAHTTLQASATAGVAGDTHYVAADHSEVATTITMKGTTLLPDRILCVTRTGSAPVAADLIKGASITSPANTAFTLTCTGYIYGLILGTGTGTSAVFIILNGAAVRYRNCDFCVNTTGASGVQTGAGIIFFEQCKIKFSATTQQGFCGSAGLANFVSWDGFGEYPLTADSVIPTSSIFGSAVNTHDFTIKNVDFTGLTQSNLTTLRGNRYTFINCKLHTSTGPIYTSFNVGLRRGQVDLINCHSGSGVHRNERTTLSGLLTTETTIVRAGGASNGVTPYSWKLVPRADNTRDFPFETFEGIVWNAAVGSPKTLTIHTVTDNLTLTDAEIWLEVDYLGNASQPLGVPVSDAALTVLTVGVAQPASTEAWTTTGLTTPVKQKLEVTFTPLMEGPIRWRIRYARTTGTVYVCPKAELS